MNTYYPGQTVRLSDVVQVAGANANPSTIAVLVRDPNGIETSYSPTLDSTGAYHYDLTLPAGATAGTWSYKWTSQATPPAVQNGVSAILQFQVVAQPF